MKPSASEKSSDSCLSVPSRTGSAPSVALSGIGRHRGLGAAQGGDPPEDVAAQFLELAGEAHDVDQRRAQIVADDIGEALDFVVGLAQIGGALVDGGLEIEIVVAQLGFGLVTRARGAPHQEDRNAGERDHQAGAGDGDGGGAASGCGRHWRCGPGTAGLPRRASPSPTSRMVALVLPAAASRTSAAALVGLALLDEVHLAGELVEPGLDRRAQFLDGFDLGRIVRRQPRQLLGVGNDGGDGAFVIAAGIPGQLVSR